MRTLPRPGYQSQIRAFPRSRDTGHAVRRVRAAIALALVVLGLAALVGAGGGPAAAQTPGDTSGGTSGTGVEVPKGPTIGIGDPTKGGVVAVVSVNGFIDPVLADFMSTSIQQANKIDAVALVFQVDLQGSVIPDDQLVALIAEMQASAVPIDIWLGPTGSELTGKAAYLLLGAGEFAMAPGTRLESITAPMDLALPAGTVLPPLTGRQADRVKAMTLGSPGTTRLISAGEARDLKITDRDAPTLGEFFVTLPGVQTKQTQVNGVTRLEPVTSVVFSQLPLLDSFFHTVASPAVAFLLLTIGLSLLIFELFTAGVGVAGVLGAGSFVFACYGLTVLPTHWWGLALLVASMLAFAIDVQTGIPRFWTGAGMVMYVLGALTMYNGVSMSWLTLGVGVIGVALAFFMGMPSMVRTRFSTPTIGREWMIGEMGRAVSDIDPDGVVQIKGAQWRAYTNRATPISQLDSVRVIGIEGLVLEVEPEEGAARDYRERGPKESKGATDADGSTGSGDAPGPDATEASDATSSGGAAAAGPEA